MADSGLMSFEKDKYKRRLLPSGGWYYEPTTGTESPSVSGLETTTEGVDLNKSVNVGGGSSGLFEAMMDASRVGRGIPNIAGTNVPYSGQQWSMMSTLDKARLGDPMAIADYYFPFSSVEGGTTMRPSKRAKAELDIATAKAGLLEKLMGYGTQERAAGLAGLGRAAELPIESYKAETGRMGAETERGGLGSLIESRLAGAEKERVQAREIPASEAAERGYKGALTEAWRSGLMKDTSLSRLEGKSIDVLNSEIKQFEKEKTTLMGTMKNEEAAMIQLEINSRKQKMNELLKQPTTTPSSTPSPTGVTTKPKYGF